MPADYQDVPPEEQQQLPPEAMGLPPQGSMHYSGTFGGMIGAGPSQEPQPMAQNPRPIASFTAAQTRPVGSASFSAAEMGVDQQFAEAHEHSAAYRALGYGRGEHAGEHQVRMQPMSFAGRAERDAAAFHAVVPNYEAKVANHVQPDLSYADGKGVTYKDAWNSVRDRWSGRGNASGGTAENDEPSFGASEAAEEQR